MSTTQSLIARVRVRMALAAAAEDFALGASWGAGAAVVVVAADRLRLVDWPTSWALASGAVVAAAFPIAGLLLRRRDDAAVAAIADERLGLRERLSTALWWRRTNAVEAAQFGPLVLADADAAAALVKPSAVAAAFRPRVGRRRLFVALAFVVACGAAASLERRADVPLGETEAARVVRLADANRIAEVARKLHEAAKRVEEDATQRKEGELAKVAADVRKKTEPLTRSPTPPREEALRQLNSMADLAREQARRSAGFKEPTDPKEAADLDKDLEELLENMSNAGLETLQHDLRELEERLKKAGGGGEDRPSGDEVRALAKRLDSLRKAMERAAAEKAAGNESVLRRLRNIGNEELLSKIAQRMREIGSRLDRGQDYQGLESEPGEEKDLSQMSEEELKKLLDDLDQMAGMKDLEDMVRQGGGEMSGGRKLRISGGGRRSGDGKKGGGGGEKNGENTPGQGPGGEGQGTGKRPNSGNEDQAFRAENLKGKIDPKGRITVTTFRGLPKPGEVTVELREALQRARDDAQAPLDSEEIPRRYRDGIRDYFDDLGRSK